MDELSTRVRESLSGVQLTDPVEQVVARGRSIRRRRNAFSALATLGVVATGSLAVALTAGGDTADVDVQLASWSVNTNKDQTVTVTVRELSDPEKLTEVMRSAGVRAKVQFVQIPATSKNIGCYKLAGPGVRPLDSDKVLSGGVDANGDVSMTVTPTAMPEGSVLSFVVFGRGEGQDLGTSMTLFDNQPGTCVPLTDEQVQAERDAQRQAEADAHRPK
jgi:hypothetical protein